MIEIVSNDSVRRDRFDKLREYGRAGVREYWVIEPRPGKLRADFLQLDETGEYALIAGLETTSATWHHPCRFSGCGRPGFGKWISSIPSPRFVRLPAYRSNSLASLISRHSANKTA